MTAPQMFTLGNAGDSEHTGKRFVSGSPEKEEGSKQAPGGEFFHVHRWV